MNNQTTPETMRFVVRLDRLINAKKFCGNLTWYVIIPIAAAVMVAFNAIVLTTDSTFNWRPVFTGVICCMFVLTMLELRFGDQIIVLLAKEMKARREAAE